MQTQTIRTTISLPVDFHSQLRLMALREKKSISDVLMQKLAIKKKLISMSLQDDFDFFAKVRGMGEQIDAVMSVRKDRDSH
ncbi:hypothetical protein KKA49_02965 [Patescibacteria group bacterium]|nr:hypothetical protein [Patescibacteria group bacterium]MBU1457417.1 hypothetical protein [Patescibacteria group bacterium]